MKKHAWIVGLPTLDGEKSYTCQVCGAWRWNSWVDKNFWLVEAKDHSRNLVVNEDCDESLPPPPPPLSFSPIPPLKWL